MLTYAKRIVELTETASSELTMLSTYSGILKIGSVHTVYDCHLHKYISKYYDNYNFLVNFHPFFTAYHITKS